MRREKEQCGILELLAYLVERGELAEPERGDAGKHRRQVPLGEAESRRDVDDAVAELRHCIQEDEGKANVPSTQLRVQWSAPRAGWQASADTDEIEHD